ncbi:4Fe-4S dicluster domain-containing protein [Candidatus Thorarchaeota archaeon]|nr:MAG: 4Fe-4S dicluster domain-containing protein [Candidatus Thorarchaeota archaeon]
MAQKGELFTTRRRKHRHNRQTSRSFRNLRPHRRRSQRYAPQLGYPITQNRNDTLRRTDVSLTGVAEDSQSSRFHVRSEVCVGCGVCADVCPWGAIVIQNGKAQIEPARCAGCGACVQACPRGAIQPVF